MKGSQMEMLFRWNSTDVQFVWDRLHAFVQRIRFNCLNLGYRVVTKPATTSAGFIIKNLIIFKTLRTLQIAFGELIFFFRKINVF
ncbi:hypothetical protein WH96_11240 [Kiloniella spongiae]|uniref:Uncharacterized protein n=1 Tax=Kiloniella spongiae TaxID=1489064 RepID=A0A0H2MFL2_9PROT|nr:hypothetical protein WH96_11240 [Kiloniella spongiae]